MQIVHVNVQAVVPGAITCNANVARVQIQQATIALSVHTFRERQLPTQSIVECQVMSSGALILAIEEPPSLPLGRIQVCVHTLEEVGDIAERKRGEAQPRTDRA